MPKQLTAMDKTEILTALAVAGVAISRLKEKVHPTTEVFDTARWTEKHMKALVEEVERV